MLLKRAADIAEALYSVPRPHSQLQALPSSPVHGSVMGLSSYPSQLGVSIGDPGQSSSQGKIDPRKSVQKNNVWFYSLLYAHNSLESGIRKEYMQYISYYFRICLDQYLKKEQSNRMEYCKYCKSVL